jgi:dihydrofolate synthase/folylpolyglutamate synthase
MTYPETLAYLDSFINYEKLAVYPYKEFFKLERIRNFLDIIGNPQGALKCVHIAGTKGKGSTCAFISYILKEAGYKTGLYTSPHLSDFRERVRILQPYRQGEEKAAEKGFEGMIPQEDLIRLMEYLRPQIEEYNKDSQLGALSFFEAYTALAFIYFKEQEVDLVVLETGLGGRLDATNTVDSLVCAITPISYEHTQKLGNTLREIAYEKAGIIKSSSPVISAPQEEEAGIVIRNKCQEYGAKLYVVGSQIRYECRGLSFSIKGEIGRAHV